MQSRLLDYQITKRTISQHKKTTFVTYVWHYINNDDRYYQIIKKSQNKQLVKELQCLNAPE